MSPTRLRSGHIYVVVNPTIGNVKFGLTTDLPNRLRSHAADGFTHAAYVSHSMPAAAMRDAEQIVLGSARLVGGSPVSGNEYFALTDTLTVARSVDLAKEAVARAMADYPQYGEHRSGLRYLIPAERLLPFIDEGYKTFTEMEQATGLTGNGVMQTITYIIHARGEGTVVGKRYGNQWMYATVRHGTPEEIAWYATHRQRMKNQHSEKVEA